MEPQKTPATDAPQELTPEQKKAEWEKICKESKGTRLMLSGSLEEKAREFQAKLDAHVKLTQEYNKAQAFYDHAKDVFFFELRKELEAAGMAEAWENKLAFDHNAVEDGFMVINVSAGG